MARVQYGLAAVASAFLLAACGAPTEETPEANAEAPPGKPTTPSPLNTPPAFDDERVDTWSLSLTEQDQATLEATAPLEVYVPAKLTISGEDVGTVGVRYKGSFGTLYTCFDETTGAQLCPKVSLKVKFDAFEDGKRWRGLKRINLHGLGQDGTLLHERLGYQLFREMGIPAPRSVHGRVFMNGDYLGVYAVTEQIDGPFIRNHFPDDPEGTLYKEVWPTVTDPAYFAAGARTNEDNTVLHERFAAFANELVTAAPDALPSVLDRRMDLDHLYRYLAVDQTIGNWDGITAFYCGPGRPRCENHNYYVYAEENGERFWLIPWDLDLTLSFSYGFALSAHGFDAVPAWDASVADCTALYPVWSNTTAVIAPACDAVFRGLQRAKDPRYFAALQKLLDGPFRLEKMYADLDRWSEQIAEHVIDDPGVNPDSWRWELGEFKRDLELMRLRAEVLRDGREPKPYGLSPDSLNDFETVDAYGFAVATTTSSDPDATITRRINSVAPLNGLADARVDFEFRDGPTTGPWDHWAQFRIAFAEETVDLSDATQLHVRLASNVPRTVRIELASPAYGKDVSARLGWTVEVPAGPSQHTLALADLAFPDWANVSGVTAADILPHVGQLVFAPKPVGRESSGLFPPGVTDRGFLQIDDLELVR